MKLEEIIKIPFSVFFNIVDYCLARPFIIFFEWAISKKSIKEIRKEWKSTFDKR